MRWTANSVHRRLGTMLGFGLLISGCAGADSVHPMPSYAEEVARMQVERRASGAGPTLTAEDQQALKDASRQLAADMPMPGLKVGAAAPDFTLPNAQGNSVTLSQLLKRGPVILIFYRGAWCPYCNLQLRIMNESLPQFQRHGAQLVAVTPQLPDKSLEQVQRAGYPFEILSDLDNHVMRAYNLYFEVPDTVNEIYKRAMHLDLAEYNGTGRYGLPVPGAFVIDSRGIIRGTFADTDYTKRVEPREILHVLETMPVVTIQ